MISLTEMPKSLEDIKDTTIDPTFEEMTEYVQGAIGCVDAAGVTFQAWPWTEGQLPTLDDVRCVYKDREQPLMVLYLQACLLSGKPIPRSQRSLVERLVDPESFYKKLEETENLVKYSFDNFLLGNPTLHEAAEKLMELAHDHWQEHLDEGSARKQILQAYPDHKWRGKLIL